MNFYKKIFSILLIAIIITGCSFRQTVDKGQTKLDLEIKSTSSAESDINDLPLEETANYTQNFTYDVEPETFKLSISSNGKQNIISMPKEARKVENKNISENYISWTYPEENIDVVIEKNTDYLDIKIKFKGQETDSFIWPSVSADKYIIPFGEGKQFSNDDTYWKEYLDNNNMNAIESLSMQFFVAQWDNFSALYIIDNPYDNQLKFNSKDKIQFDFKHEFPSINPEKEYGFKIYVTDNQPVSATKIYRNYIIKQEKFKTLEQKSVENENIKKLYGAPHIYFYPMSAIAREDILWTKLKESIKPELIEHIYYLLKNSIEDGAEYVSIFEELKTQDNINKYSQTQIVKALNLLLFSKDFYNYKVFKDINIKAQELLEKGIENLNQSQLLDLNKNLLAVELAEAVNPINTWSFSDTINILEDMNTSGIKSAWIGLDEWKKGLYNKDFVNKAKELGYLIGTYDSYHSIHKPDNEKWSTAEFTDKTLFDSASIKKENGEFYEGFQGEGRKLNPTLAMPSVKERINTILDNGLNYNSWFIDCDATGEIYNDYSEKHITTQKQDLEARIERLVYIKDEKNMVIGSEGGNDFANDIIAFAHGIETPAFSWMDKDMSKNKESEYYLGRYYSATGGVPEFFAKETPIKDFYYQIFINPKYSIPLYKLVYNDSVITTHQWGWPTTKIENYKEIRMLKEILYNVPPLYQMDSKYWEEHKNEIIKHSNFFSSFSSKVINKEMTNFQILSADNMVQMTEYNGEIKVIANFSENVFEYNNTIIKSKTIKVFDLIEEIEYKPEF